MAEECSSEVKEEVLSLIKSANYEMAAQMEEDDLLQHRYLSTEASASVDTVDEEIDRFALAPVATSQILTLRAA